MSILGQLATSLGRRDEVPNQELAKKIAGKNDKLAVKELVHHLSDKSKDIQHDCIKVLYEIGEQKPSLISGYTKEFVALLESKNNRMQWGAMSALDAITLEDPKTIYVSLGKIIASADKGSVITNDRCVNILVKLCGIKGYSEEVFPLLVERILVSPPNQMPTYAEKTMPFVTTENKTFFLKTLTSRLSDIETDTKRRRVEKIIKKLRGK